MSRSLFEGFSALEEQWPQRLLLSPEKVREVADTYSADRMSYGGSAPLKGVSTLPGRDRNHPCVCVGRTLAEVPTYCCVALLIEGKEDVGSPGEYDVPEDTGLLYWGQRVSCQGRAFTCTFSLRIMPGDRCYWFERPCGTWGHWMVHARRQYDTGEMGELSSMFYAPTWDRR